MEAESLRNYLKINWQKLDGQNKTIEKYDIVFLKKVYSMTLKSNKQKLARVLQKPGLPDPNAKTP